MHTQIHDLEKFIEFLKGNIDCSLSLLNEF
jgi:hypothetical protein